MFVRWMNVPDHFPLEKMLPHLSNIERYRAGTFRFRKNRQMYCAAHILMRIAIQRVYGLQIKDFQYRQNGVPKVILGSGNEMQVSLSHSNGLVAVAFSLERRIGVDIENDDCGCEIGEVLVTTLNDVEQSDLVKCTGREELADMFLRRWTLKEAIVKATGQGLAVNFRSFAVTSSPARLLTRAPDGSLADQWQLYSSRVDGGYLAAAAHEATRLRVSFDVERVGYSGETFYAELSPRK